MVTDILGITPDQAHRKGEQNITITKKGKRIAAAPYRSGLWCIDSKADECGNFEHHIKSLMTLLYPLKKELLGLSDRGYQMDLYCSMFAYGIHQPGFDIEADTLFQMGELNIAMSMSIYP